MPIFAMNKELRKEIYIMTTMELRSSLLQEIASIIESDELTRKTLEYVRKLNTKAASHQSTPPCQYTTKELEERLTASMKSYHQGKYCTSEELRKRHPQCE